MARRRKKAKTPKPAAATGGGAEKALPSLPPGAAPLSAFTPEAETPPDLLSDSHSSLQGPRSPRDTGRQAMSGSGGKSSGTLQRDVSPVSDDPRRGEINLTRTNSEGRPTLTNRLPDATTLPASTYNDKKPSNVSSSNDDDDSERGYLPMAFDPTPVLAPSAPLSSAIPPKKPVQRSLDPSPTGTSQKENHTPRDYFGTNGKLTAKPPARDASLGDHRPGTGNASSRSVSTERETDRERSKPSPHILYQDKGRNKMREQSGSNTPTAASPVVAESRDRAGKPQQLHPLTTDTQTLSPSSPRDQEGFKLQEVPDAKRAGSRKNSKSGSPMIVSPVDKLSREGNKPVSPTSASSQNSGVNPFDDPRRKDASSLLSSFPVPAKHADRGLPLRGDSLAAANAMKPKQEIVEALPQTNTSAQTQVSHDRQLSTSSTYADARSTSSRDNGRAEPPSHVDGPPPRAASRPSAPSKSVANDDFIAPRHAPPPPPAAHRPNDSISTMHSEDRPSIDGRLSPSLRSAGLPKYSLDGGFSMDDEMGRILRGEHGQQESKPTGSASPSVLRRVSNAVKHGRSFSDRAATTQGARNGSMDMGTPSISSPTGVDGLDSLRASLKRAQYHIAELETEKLSLQEKLDGSSDIKAVNTELREKRTTMAFLDTQREMVVRELEVMTDHLSKAKDSSQPLDLGLLKTNILREFAESLQKLKDNMGTQIEDLMNKRNELTDEIGNLIQMKDKGFQEYESLSSKNTQLSQHNNELIRSIQGMYQDYRVPNGGPNANGLGITTAGGKMDSTTTEMRVINPTTTDSSMSNLMHDHESESATILSAPQVISIRKTAQPKKFNWRRGGEKITGKVTKGIKGAFVGQEEKRPQGPYSIGLPYNATQVVAGSDQSSINSKGTPLDEMKAAGYGFFGQKNGTGKGNLSGLKNSSSTNLVAVDGSGKCRILIAKCALADLISFVWL